MNYIHCCIFMWACVAALGASAMTLQEAKNAYELGDFEEAAPVLAEQAKQHPKDAKLNTMAGIALYYSGKENEAVHFLKLGTNEANLFMAQIEMHRYNFEQATEYVDRYEDGFKKRKRDKRPEREEATEIRDLIERGQSMLDRVENIIIIDSLSVDRDQFFKAYKLSKPTGSLHSPDELPRQFAKADPTVVFATENADELFWAMPDENEDFRLATSTLLADNTWEKATLLPSLLNEGGDANYPFMMSDGITLYYANTGENSLGGYDIFITRRDGDTFYQPQNIGMPYNSYANDYMLAIDETTGVGWWATDRNAAPDRLTIYMFIPSDLRVNYQPDAPDLRGRAFVSDYRATWPAGADYSELLDKVAKLNSTDNTDQDEFRFAVPTRGFYTKLSDFRSQEARSLMKEYLARSHDFDLDRRKLAVLRAEYAKGNQRGASEILRLEKDEEYIRDEMRHLANRIISAELNSR